MKKTELNKKLLILLITILSTYACKQQEEYYSVPLTQEEVDSIRYAYFEENGITPIAAGGNGTSMIDVIKKVLHQCLGNENFKFKNVESQGFSSSHYLGDVFYKNRKLYISTKMAGIEGDLPKFTTRGSESNCTKTLTDSLSRNFIFDANARRDFEVKFGLSAGKIKDDSVIVEIAEMREDEFAQGGFNKFLKNNKDKEDIRDYYDDLKNPNFIYISRVIAVKGIKVIIKDNTLRDVKFNANTNFETAPANIDATIKFNAHRNKQGYIELVNNNEIYPIVEYSSFINLSKKSK